MTHLFMSLSHRELHPYTPSCLNILTYISLSWKITNSYNFYPIQLNNTLCKQFEILEIKLQLV